MINNNSNNVINFTSLTGVRKKKDNKASNKYIVSLFENKKYMYNIEASNGEDAENIISDKYEKGVLDLNSFEAFTYETIAELVEK